MERIVAADTPFSKICAHPYLQRQLIAYLGNKRRLLPFFARVFAELAQGVETPRFLDPFAGSGAVARLGKLMGFTVTANDWEPYSYLLNTAFVGIDRSELSRLFGWHGGIEGVLAELNALHPAAKASHASSGAPPEDGAYISLHYAPASTADGDYRVERLFYTRENAVFIDRVRDQIEAWYPSTGAHDRGDAAREKALLIALLLVEASTHANTSGVFKAYHKGFGGHGGDALTRILAPMELEIPVLIDGAAPAGSAMENAAAFLRGRSAEVIYLDPPYNTHQYGSNYFMLNTIARWDKPPVSDQRDEDGRLIEKAGIRSDWTETRSDYCSPQRAAAAFAELLREADGRHIVLSYNTEGVVPLHELVDLLEAQGRVQLHAQDYVKYRGGKQSLHRRTWNTEFLLVVTRDERPRSSDRLTISSFLRRRRLEALLAEPHNPARIAERFQAGADGQLQPREEECAGAGGAPGAGGTPGANGAADTGGAPGAGGPPTTAVSGAGPAGAAGELPLRLEDGHRLSVDAAKMDELSPAQVEDLETRLEYTVCRSRHEEVEVLAAVLRTCELTQRARRRIVASLLKALRKFAYRKYEELFRACLADLEAAATATPELYPGLSEGLARLAELIRVRNGGDKEEAHVGRDRGGSAD